MMHIQNNLASTPNLNRNPNPNPQKRLGLGKEIANPRNQPRITPRPDCKKVPVLIILQMKWKPFEVVAISPEPGAVTALFRERRMLPLNHFRESAHRLVGIHLAILIREPLVYINC